MNRQTIRLNEAQLNRLVKQTVKRVLKEVENSDKNQQIETLFDKFDKAVDSLIRYLSEEGNFTRYEALNRNLPYNGLAGFLRSIYTGSPDIQDIQSYSIMEGGFDYDEKGNLILVDTDFFKHNLNRALTLLTRIEQYFSKRGGGLSNCLNAHRISTIAGYCISYLVKIANIAGFDEMLSDGYNNTNNLPVGEFVPDWYKTMSDLPDYLR